MAYNDIDSGKVLNKEGLLELSGQIKGYIEDNIPQAYTLPTASTTALGGVKVDGETITINDGVISATGGSDTTKIINVTTLANILEDEELDTALKEIQTALYNNGTINYVVYLDNMLAMPVVNSNNTYPKLRVLKNQQFLNYVPTSANERVYYYSTTNYALDSSIISVPTANQIGSKNNVAETIGYIKTNYATKDYVDVKVPNVSTTATDGVYKLTSTVASGTATYAWEEDSGGGTTYTAGSGIDITNNVISTTGQFSGDYNDLSNKPTIPVAYTLPTATTSTLGGVKVDGETITIADGVISAVGGSGSGSGGGTSIQDIMPFLYAFLTKTANANTNLVVASSNKSDFITKLKAGRVVIGYSTYSNLQKTDFWDSTDTLYSIENFTTPVSNKDSFSMGLTWRFFLYNNLLIYWNHSTNTLGDCISIGQFYGSTNAKISLIDGLKYLYNNKLTTPTVPTDDGDYVLQVSVSSGTPTYSWVAVTTGGSY